MIAALTFLVQGYGQWKKAVLLITVVAIGSFGIMPTLSEALHEIYVENRIARLIARYVREPSAQGLYGSEIQIQRFTVTYLDDMLHVKVQAEATRDRFDDAQARLDEFRRQLSRDLGEPVVINLQVVPIEILRFTSAPGEGEK